MVLYVTLVFCAFGAGALVYRRDLYEREPLGLIVLTVVMGIGAMWLAGVIEALTFDNVGISHPRAIAAVAALEEELLKFLVVITVILLVPREFNDPLDGIVYGSMAGLGMAIEESVYYLSDLLPGSFILPPAELTRVMGHLVMGGISGFGLGPAVLGWRRWPLILLACFFAATTLHFGWDWIVLSSTEADLEGPEAWRGVALMLAGLLLYGALTTIASAESHSLFAPASHPRLWGWPFVRHGAGSQPSASPGTSIPGGASRGRSTKSE
jgi:RsiW-degrading membrane proteinase PrsW (M82 family)